MSQDYENISPSEKISTSLAKLKKRDSSCLSTMSGTIFPDNIADSDVGMFVDRTDVKALYRLSATTPNLTWTKLLDYGSSGDLNVALVPKRSDIVADFQARNSTLDALSTLTPIDYTIPFFQTVTNQTVIMGLLQLNSWSVEWLTQTSTADVVAKLGLGSLATKDQIVGADDIVDNTVTQDKLAFDVASAGYDTGDLMETVANKTIEDGWVKIVENGTIGDAQSYVGVKTSYHVADDRCYALFCLLHDITNLKVYRKDGTILPTLNDAETDWADHCRVEVPPTLGRVMVGTNSPALLCKTETLNVATLSQGSGQTSFNKVYVKNYIRL